MSRVYGLTGSIGAGKSTVGRLLAELGCEVIDADVVARSVVDNMTTSLREAFPEAYVQGILDRRKLAAILFSDSEKKAWLESRVHPRVRHEMKLMAQISSADIVIMEVPLLFESHFVWADKVIVVVADDAVRMERVMKRSGLTEQEFAERDAAQMSQEKKLARATWVIDNTEGDIEPKVHELYGKLLDHV